MEKIKLMHTFFKDLFKNKFWWILIILFPFSLVGFVLAAAYYIIASIFMIFDLIKLEVESLLIKKTNDESVGVQIVKHIFGFPVVISTKMFCIIFIVLMSILYFLTDIMFFIASAGTFRKTPFGFHK